MKKVKIMPFLLALALTLAGCERPNRPNADETSQAESEESTQASAVETTTAETPVTEVSTQVIAEPTEETLFQNYGTSNTVNSGICCTDGERFYYSDTNTQKLYRTENGTATEIADQFYGYYLNLSGDIIYYADAAADNCVTAYDLTSGNRTVICDMHVQELTLYKEKLYFSCIDGDQKTIYRMNTDGSGLESLASCEDLWYMTIYKDVIYYVNYENDQYAILSMQLNATYSRCLNYMNGQLYYYGSEESERNVYSCDLEGNITGRYTSGAKFLMLMENELYYYDWDEVLHILPLDKKSEEENTSYGTNIVSYQQEEVLQPIRRYLEPDWSGYTLDENSITKQGNIWKNLLTKSGSQQRYELTINLTTGKVTILCTTEDILPISAYLFDQSAVQLPKDEMENALRVWTGKHYYKQYVAWQIAYHDYDKNGTYEAFAMCGPMTGFVTGEVSYNLLDAVLFISSSGEITVVADDFQDKEFYLFDGSDFVENYIEYDGKGYYLPSLRVGAIGFDIMYGVKNNKPYEAVCGGQITLDEEVDLCYYPNSGYLHCQYCTGMDKNGERVKKVEHKHILIYDEKIDDYVAYVKYASGEVVKLDDLIS